LLALNEQLGIRAIKIGEEAVVNLKAFTITGKSGQDLHTARNRLTKLGHQISLHEPPLTPGLLDELKLVSDERLGRMKSSEKKLSVGWFEQAYVMKTPLAVVRTADGRISAFANLVAATAAKAIAIDLRRQRADMMDGTLDFCLFLDFNTAKIRAMNAFISVSRHFRASANGPHWPGMERVLHDLDEHLNNFYNFKGLHAYKEKFKPTWEPRYLVFEVVGLFWTALIVNL
jgi:phosphatidylglycerol lysyltransferase